MRPLPGPPGGPSAPSRPWVAPALTLLFAAAFVGAGLLGRATRLELPANALVWPASAVAVLWVAVFWRRPRWLALAAAALAVATFGLNVATGAPATLAAAFTIANVAQPFVVGVVFTRLRPGGWVLERTRDLAALVVAGGAGAVVGAVPAAAALALTTEASFLPATATWAFRHGVSTVVLVAAGLRAARLRPPWALAPLTAVQKAELAVQVPAFVAAHALVFGDPDALPLMFIVLSVAVWVGLRRGTTFAVLSAALSAAIVVAATLQGRGPLTELPPETRAVVAQLFVLVVATVGIGLPLQRDERQALIARLRRARAAADEQSSLLDAVIGTISDGVFAVDARGGRVIANPAMTQLFGDEEVPPERWAEHYGLYNPDGMTAALGDLPLGRALAGESVTNADVLVRHPRTAQEWVLNVSALPLPAPAGGAVATFHDVTAVRRSTCEITAARDLLQSVLDAATEQSVIGTDADGLVTVFNSGAELMLGWTQAEVLGRPLDSFHVADELAARARDLGVATGLEALLYDAGGPQARTRQWTYRTREGCDTQVHLSLSARRDPDGRVTGYIGVATDVTEQVQAERALSDSERLFRMAFETAPVALVVAATVRPAPGTLLRVNAAMSALTGRPADELITLTLPDVVHPADRDEASALLDALITGKLTEARCENRFLRPDGTVAWGVCSATRLEGPGEPTVLVLVEDVTARREAEAALVHQALHDTLTGLPNRALLGDRLQHALDAGRRSGHPVGVLYLDLDGFKAVNDSGGHAAGDALLVQVGERLARTVRPGDTVARLGGDEFAVVCPAVDSLETLRHVAARVLEAVRTPFSVAAVGAVHISGSLGMVVAHPGAHPEQVLRDADEAMYAAKRAGKNRLAGHGSDVQVRAARVARLVPELHSALSRDELVMHGQPLHDLITGRVVAVESLLRWAHPRRGVLPPAEFLDVVESSPLMIPVGRRALYESYRIAAAWSEVLGPDAPDVHVNVSGRQLDSGHISDEVLTALHRYRLPATQLVLELTETHLPLLEDSLRSDLSRLREAGVRIAVDDIGTGYSSLTRLTELPVDLLKIEMRFVAGLGLDPSCDAVVRAVLGIGQALGLSVVAEGVETPQQADMLRRLGCVTAQGYLFSRPRPEARLTDLLADRVATPARLAGSLGDEA